MSVSYNSFESNLENFFTCAFSSLNKRDLKLENLGMAAGCDVPPPVATPQ